MFLDEGSDASPEQQQAIVINIAHTLAQQWTGNYVTMDWWANLWLNGGLAEFYQTYFEENVSIFKFYSTFYFIVHYLTPTD